MRNLYEVLEVSPKASSEVITASFKALSKRYHPDRKGGSEAAQKEIGEAYSVLSDPAKRKVYDEQLEGAKFEEAKQNYEKSKRSPKKQKGTDATTAAVGMLVDHLVMGSGNPRLAMLYEAVKPDVGKLIDVGVKKLRGEA